MATKQQCRALWNGQRVSMERRSWASLTLVRGALKNSHHYKCLFSILQTEWCVPNQNLESTWRATGRQMKKHGYQKGVQKEHYGSAICRNKFYAFSCLQTWVHMECKRSISMEAYLKRMHTALILSALGVYQTLLFHAICSLNFFLGCSMNLFCKDFLLFFFGACKETSGVYLCTYSLGHFT